jgi:hypothetical protein
MKTEALTRTHGMFPLRFAVASAFASDIASMCMHTRIAYKRSPRS